MPNMNNAYAETRPTDHVAVTSTSAFSDNVWILDGVNTAKPRRSRVINWSVRLGEEGTLTDPNFSQLLQSSKRFIWCLMLGRTVRGANKGSTVMAHFQALTVFLRWMTTKGFSRFADLGPADVSEFASIAKMKPTKSGKQPDGSTIYHRLIFLKYLIEVGDDIQDRPRADFPSEMLDGVKKKTGAPIPYIPDSVCMQLYAHALEWLRAGDDLASLWGLIRSARSSNARFSLPRRNVLVREMLQSTGKTIQIGKSIIPTTSMTVDDLKALLTKLNTACYIIVAGFTGMRVSEISSLNIGCLREVDVDGLASYVLNGRLIKTAFVASERERWIAGPADADNPIALAVRLLETLWQGERTEQKVDALFVNFANSITLTRLTENAINFRLQSFVDEMEGIEWDISTHQFRKAFARHVARCDSMAPLALKRHFKHMDIQMTGHYIGTDMDLLTDVLLARGTFAEEILDDVLGAERLAGKMGVELLKRNSKFRGVAGKEARSQQVKLLMENTDLVVIPHAYGLCFYRRDVAACQGSQRRVGVDTCVGCNNFVVGERHLSYWTDRHDQLTKFRNQVVDEGPHHRIQAIDDELTEANTVISLIEGM